MCTGNCTSKLDGTWKTDGDSNGCTSSHTHAHTSKHIGLWNQSLGICQLAVQMLEVGSAMWASADSELNLSFTHLQSNSFLSCCYWQQSHPHTPGNTHTHTHLATLTPTHAWPCSMYIKAHGINNHFKFIHTSLPINLSTSIYTCCYLLFFRRSLAGQIGTEHLTIYLT